MRKLEVEQERGKKKREEKKKRSYVAYRQPYEIGGNPALIHELHLDC